jgi:NADPH:quinone reductase-like Zn-dependent oxidoreductase
MRALARKEYGPPREVLELADVEVPTIKDNEVLVRVHAASVNAADPVVVRGIPYMVRPVEGLRRPKRHVIGQDLAGTVERIGAKVTRFTPGDEVFGGGHGTFAEYASAPEGSLALKPPGVGFVEAAALPMAGLTALQGLRDAACVGPGQKVLVNGASGGVGTFAVQIAKALGAEVTAVCSTRNMTQARKLGADHVIDYTEEEFTETGVRFDVIFDNAASRSLADTRRLLADGGVIIPNGGMLDRRWLASIPRMLGAKLMAIFTRTRAKILSQTWDRDDLVDLVALVEDGQVSPVIDRTYELAEAVDAIAYIDAGHAGAKVVIEITPVGGSQRVP